MIKFDHNLIIHESNFDELLIKMTGGADDEAESDGDDDEEEVVLEEGDGDL